MSSRPDPIRQLNGLWAAELARSPVLSEKRALAPFAQYEHDPVGFARDVLRFEPWGRYEGMPAEHASQIDLLRAIEASELVAWRSGHKVGKSTGDALIALWWTMCQPRGRVTLSAPSWDQIADIVWPEVRMLHGGRHPGQAPGARPLPGRLYKNADNGLELDDGWGIWGVSTDTPERMAGRSGSKQLFLIDEASGYDEAILEAVFGNLAGGGKALLTGNPTQLVGTFYNAFQGRAGRWRCLHTPSTSTPNFHGGHVDGLATLAWEEERREAWGGPGNPIYDVRVLGEFPSQGEMAVVALALVEAGRCRWEETTADGRLELGVDPARGGGDEAIVAPRRGRKVLPLYSLPVDAKDTRTPPGHQVGARVAAIARELYRDGGGRRPRIKVDAIGIGSSVVDYLWANHGDDFEIIAVVSSEAADGWVEVRPGRSAKDEYDNKRTQLIFAVADFLRQGGALPDDMRLHADLVATKYKFTPRGKMAAESKDEIKKRLKRSPDRGDAVALAIYEPPTLTTDHSFGGGGQRRWTR